MDKRYQVFVSSTYADLKQERQKVIQALMEMDCIPAGMELFPAADDEQWEFIKRVINDCDYYILIIGGRYGSLTTEGISYTEKEYDYAISIGLKVLSFIHGSPDEISVAKSEIDPSLRKKLDEFRQKACSNRLVKFWKTAEELPGLVALSLSKTIKIYPAIGWVRADNITSNELLVDLNDLRKENQQLKKTLAELEPMNSTESQQQLASLNETMQVTLECDGIPEDVKTTWAEIFAGIAPELIEGHSDNSVNYALGSWLYRKSHPGRNMTTRVQYDDFITIRVQLTTLGLIKTSYSGKTHYWSLTNRGQKMMMQLRTVKTAFQKNGDNDSSGGA